MTAAWTGSLGELHKMRDQGSLVSTLIDRYQALHGDVSDAEISSWGESLPALLDVLAARDLRDVQVLLEMQMPVGAERADVLLLGGSKDRPRAYLIELKQWGSVAFDPEASEVVMGDIRHQHPSSQVLNYEGKLRLFHSRAADYEFASAVFLHEMGPTALALLRDTSMSTIVSKAPLYGSEDTLGLLRAIREHLLPCTLAASEHVRFSEAPYEQTIHLFAVLQKHGDDIARRATAVLAEAGVGLTEEQELAVEDVLAAAREGRPITFVVEGGPGSGKTLVALTILLRALNEGIRTVFAIRNNRLQAILKRCFDASFPGASGLLLYFSTMAGTGIADDKLKGAFQLVVCDETQRMYKAHIATTLGRSPTCAVFLDETQRLNPPEQGTVHAFAEATKSLGRGLEHRQLSAAIRCRGGKPYHEWVDRLLVSPTSNRLKMPVQRWPQRYLFYACDSLDDMRSQLATLRDATPETTRVAMVASFTEAPGDMSAAKGPKNLRVGYPLTSGWDGYEGSTLEIWWLMKPSEYVNFWLGGKSSELGHVASIYGSQGFESDYVGVIWGRDLLYRSGSWILGDPAVCFDTTDRLISRKGTPTWAADALTFVQNRYRIFLTRGIAGTFVYCEDEETRKHLDRLLCS